MREPAPGIADASKVQSFADVEGGRVAVYSYGQGDNVLFLLNGGPGRASDFLRSTHKSLAGPRRRIVIHDQLETGASDRPNDPNLWTIERYAREVEAVRLALGLGSVNLLGHSWGGWLAIEYALTYPSSVRSLVLANTSADIPHTIREIERLRAALGAETVAMMCRREADGTIDHAEYKAAIELLNWRHVHRLDRLPDAMVRSAKHGWPPVYVHMQGPNEFHYTGSLRRWSRIDRLQEIRVPALLITGHHDAITPACTHRMAAALRAARVRVLPNSSHVPMVEEPEAYYAAIREFLGSL